MEIIRGPKKNDYTTRTTCRICDSNRLSELFSLGDLYVSNFVGKGETGIKAPLNLVFCDDCSLVQLKDTVPRELLYSNYWYKSGVTKTMKDALRDITQKVEEKFELKRGDVVLDIGSNDGTLLRTYTTPGIIRVGVEPAKNLAIEGGKGLEYLINDFWEAKCYNQTVGKKAKIITAIAMMYDLENPNEFMGDIANSLRDDGIFIPQLMCLKSMLELNDIGNICHEHLEYYSFASFESLLNRNGLEVFDIEINNVNGGSYRVYTQLNGVKVRGSLEGLKRVQKIREDEKDLLDKKTLIDFYNQMEENKKGCVKFIREENALGKKTWIYGASTKGNTILQYCGLTNKDIVAAAERSPSKWGKYTLGTNIPIVSEEEARKSQPDYFLVLPYAFIKEFYKRESTWRKRGGKFIVPLPEFKVLD